MKEEYKKQLKKFIEDESYFKDYEGIKPLWDFYLVRVFKFTPEESKMQKTIMVPDAQGNWNPATEVLKSKILPIVKVIRISPDAKSESIKIGGVYTVPTNEILGEDWNPDYMHMINTFKTPGGKQGSVVNLPDGVPQKIPKVEKYWNLNMFVLPKNFGYPTDEDKLTYLIPSSKLKSEYEHLD